MMMHGGTKRLTAWAGVVALILAIPATMMLFGAGGWNWSLSDFAVLGTVLFGAGLAYELLARRSGNTAYQAAFGIGLAGAVLLFWVNGAVGLIGDGDINLLYGAVFVIGLIGSLMARFQPRGMAHTLFAVAAVQMLVPVIALVTGAQDFRPGIAQVFMLNGFFAMIFVTSALLFRRAARDHS